MFVIGATPESPKPIREIYRRKKEDEDKTEAKEKDQKEFKVNLSY